MTKLHEHKFPSYDAFVAAAYLEKNPLVRTRESQLDNRVDWHGGKTFAQAKALALTGDLETAKTLAPSIIEGATDMMLKAARFDPVYQVEGGRWVDVGRFCSGEPECFVDMTETHEARRKGVGIVFNAGGAWNINARTFEKIGKVIAETTLGLQAMGYVVALHIVYRALGGHGDASNVMLLHFPMTTDGLADTSKLAAVCSAWFFRRIAFGVMETRDDAFVKAFTNAAYANWGQTMTEKEARHVVGDDSATTIVVDMRAYANNPDRAKADILTAIKKGE